MQTHIQEDLSKYVLVGKIFIVQVHMSCAIVNDNTVRTMVRTHPNVRQQRTLTAPRQPALRVEWNV